MQPQTNRSVPQTAPTTHWVTDPSHSAATFEVRHMMVSTVRGVFRPVQASLAFDADDPTRSKITLRIPVAKVDTRDEQRDAHLRSADFLDAEHHPEIAFESREIEEAGGKRYRVTGDLSIRGTTRPVTVEVEEVGEATNPLNGKVTRGYEAHAELNRKDFGLSWNKALEAGGWLVGDKVRITVDLELVEGREGTED